MSLTSHQERVADHVVRTIGSIDGIVALRGRNPDAPPVSLLHVPVTEAKPFQFLVSAGLSALAQPVPTTMREQLQAEGHPAPPDRVELALGLPGDWPVENAGPEHTWPLRLLADLAMFPLEQEAWYMPGHTIPNFGGGSYHASTQMNCALLIEPRNLLDDAQSFPSPDGQVKLLGVVPLFPREVELKQEEGLDKLLERLEQDRVSEILIPGREAVAGLILDLLRR